jgi:cell division protein ZapA (FtsZ GTPase activity inhibitor)
MCARENTVILRIFGQNFRLRAERDDRERLERVAAAVDDQIRSNKRRGAISDTRAAVMAAFEIGCELDALVPLIDAGNDAKVAIESTGEAMDRLLARLNKEIDEKPAAPQPKQSAPRPQAKPPAKPPATPLAKPSPVERPIASSQPSFLDPPEPPAPKTTPTQEAPPRGTSQSENRKT